MSMKEVQYLIDDFNSLLQLNLAYFDLNYEHANGENRYKITLRLRYHRNIEHVQCLPVWGDMTATVFLRKLKSKMAQMIGDAI